MEDMNDQSYESGDEGKDAQGSSGSQNGGSRGRNPGRNKMMGVPVMGANGATGTRQNDFPLRILVMGDMVGAIIGRQGTTIRQITQQTRARVDVHRKDNSGSMEKAITIYGNPENCSNACKRILEVMQEEAKNTNKGTDIPLKILAHNSLIGRIIGKAGNVIKKIMQDSDTKITVSSINDINSFNYERVITIKGAIENISKAEQMISQKLKASYENDLQQMAPTTVMFPGLHPMTMMSTPLGAGYGARPPMGYFGGPGGGPPGPPHPYGPPQAVYPPMHPTGAGPPGMMNSHPQQPEELNEEETTFMYVPNSAVGALIGTKGSFIRSIIRFSNASVKIAPLAQDQQVDAGYERQVTIVGSAEAQWKAQYMIFEKMREEGYNSHGMEEVRLTVEIFVPSSQVGRIIGKGGQNVRELQRYTGASVKVPEQGEKNEEDKLRERDVSVHIIGNFYAVQSAQRRVRSMVASAYGASAVGPSGKSRNPRMGADSPSNESPTNSLQ